MSRRREDLGLRENARLGRLPVDPDDPLLDALPSFQFSTAPVELVARSSRWGRLAGITAAAIFWNGIVSVFANEAFEAWQRGRPDTFLMLFLVPFVLVGVALVIGIGASLLALRNPRAKLVASAGQVHLGETIQLRWRLEGRAERLDELTIELKAREEATYQVGTKTSTAAEEFFVRELVKLSGSQCGFGGHVSIPIPAGAMHSFESDHNKVVWELSLRGKILRWPDLVETYPLVVLPQTDRQRRKQGVS